MEWTIRDFGPSRRESVGMSQTVFVGPIIPVSCKSCKGPVQIADIEGHVVCINKDCPNEGILRKVI